MEDPEGSQGMLVGIGCWDKAMSCRKEIEAYICVIHWGWEQGMQREAPQVVFHRSGDKIGGLVLEEQK